MPTLIEIRGQDIDSRYLIASVIWQIILAMCWPIAVIGLRRAYLAYKNSNGKLSINLEAWGHLIVCQIMLTITSIDPTGIFFDASGTVNLVTLLLATTVIANLFLVSFASSIQAFAVQCTLDRPPWIAKFKRFLLAFNFTVGSIFIIIHVVLDRVYTSAFIPMMLSAEGLLVAPVFYFVVNRLTSKLKREHSGSATGLNSEQSKRILDGVKNFRRHTIISCGIMVFYATLIGIFYVPRLYEDNDLMYSNDVQFIDFTRNRAFRSTFKWSWISWLAFLFYAYLLRRHWISNSSAAGRSAKRASSTFSSKGTDAGSVRDMKQGTVLTYSQQVAAASLSQQGATYSQQGFQQGFSQTYSQPGDAQTYSHQGVPV